MLAKKHNSLRRRALLAVPTVAAAALIGAPLAPAQTQAAGSPQSATTGAGPAATTQGIIMRDGGVCDPIRHMGC
jgi:hypothetical protein